MESEKLSEKYPSRERLWTERDVEQQLEALRQQVLHLSSVVDDLVSHQNQMQHHQHAVSGELFVPLRAWQQLDNDRRPANRRYIPMGLRDKE